MIRFLTLFFGVVILSSSCANAQNTISLDGTESVTRLVVLGSGTPVPDADRFGPSVAVVVNDKAYLFDAGSGMTRRLHEARELGLRQLEPLNIQQIFITHLHSDHILDYPEFVFDYWWHRAKPISAYGPPGLKALDDAAELMFAADIERRRFDKNGNYPNGFEVSVHEIYEDGVVFEDDNVVVRAFAVDHGSWDYAYGYRVETPDRVIVISGDTNYSENLIANSAGADILVHEIYSTEGFATVSRPGVDQLHTSPENVAKVANRIKPDVLVLYHMIFYNASVESIREEIRQFYGGRLVLSDDLTIIQ